MVVVPQKCRADVAVDLGGVVRTAGPEKVRKECSCVYAETRATQTLRDEDEV